MISTLRLKNFKSWNDSGVMRLAPLTVVFGGNSAGKSSLQHALLMLKQTVDSTDRHRPLQFGDAKSLVHLGSLFDVLHQHVKTKALEVSMTWELPVPMTVNDPINGDEYEGDGVCFKVKLQADGGNAVVVDHFQYELRNAGSVTLDLKLQRSKKPGKYELLSNRYKFKKNPGKPYPLPSPRKFYGFPDEVTNRYQNAGFVSDFQLKLEDLFAKLYYMGPLRESPRRLYSWSGEVHDHAGERGDKSVDALLAATGRKYRNGARGVYKQLNHIVAGHLANMGLIHSFEIQKIGKDRSEYEVLVRSTADSALVKLTDVGFGVSQVLPVLVECYYVPSGSVVIFEQPEIHLHPSVQAALADVFVDAVNAWEGGTARGCQFIIESHSEHFLRRLQRRIAEGLLEVSKAALYFVSIESGKSKCTPLEIDKYGNILNWPKEFFGDDIEDMLARLQAQSREDVSDVEARL